MGNGTVQVNEKVIEWVWRGLVALLVPILIFLASTVIGIDRRVTALEASTFRNEQGLEVWQAIGDRPTRQEVIEELRLIREEMAGLREALAAHDGRQ